MITVAIKSGLATGLAVCSVWSDCMATVARHCRVWLHDYSCNKIRSSYTGNQVWVQVWLHWQSGLAVNTVWSDYMVVLAKQIWLHDWLHWQVSSEYRSCYSGKRGLWSDSKGLPLNEKCCTIFREEVKRMDHQQKQIIKTKQNKNKNKQRKEKNEQEDRAEKQEEIGKKKEAECS